MSSRSVPSRGNRKGNPVPSRKLLRWFDELAKRELRERFAGIPMVLGEDIGWKVGRRCLACVCPAGGYMSAACSLYIEKSSLYSLFTKSSNVSNGLREGTGGSLAFPQFPF